MNTTNWVVLCEQKPDAASSVKRSMTRLDGKLIRRFAHGAVIIILLHLILTTALGDRRQLLTHTKMLLKFFTMTSGASIMWSTTAKKIRSTDYDSEGRQAKVWEHPDAVAANAVATSYTYNSEGQITDYYFGHQDDTTTPGLRFRFDFDEWGQQTEFVTPRGDAIDPTEVNRIKTYNDDGRLQYEFGAVNESTNKRMVKEYTYDAAGRLIKVGEGLADANQSNISITRNVSYKYDPWTGRTTEKAYSDGRTIKYHYTDDETAFLERTEIWKNGVKVYFRNFAYDADGRQNASSYAGRSD